MSSQANLLILHPDIMLTATALSNASQCRRKPLLSSLVHSSSDITPSLVWGSILHEVMQKCLSESCWDERWIEDRIDEAVRANLGDLFKLNVSVEDAKREIIGRAKGLQVFSQRYLSETPKVSCWFWSRRWFWEVYTMLLSLMQSSPTHAQKRMTALPSLRSQSFWTSRKISGPQLTGSKENLTLQLTPSSPNRPLDPRQTFSTPNPFRPHHRCRPALIPLK